MAKRKAFLNSGQQTLNNFLVINPNNNVQKISNEENKQRLPPNNAPEENKNA